MELIDFSTTRGSRRGESNPVLESHLYYHLQLANQLKPAASYVNQDKELSRQVKDSSEDYRGWKRSGWPYFWEDNIPSKKCPRPVNSKNISETYHFPLTLHLSFKKEGKIGNIYRKERIKNYYTSEK